jgi:hypothetical protein
MKDEPGIDRRHFCGAAAATVAISPLGFLIADRSTAMNAVAQPAGGGAPAIRPFRVNVA